MDVRVHCSSSGSSLLMLFSQIFTCDCQLLVHVMDTDERLLLKLLMHVTHTDERLLLELLSRIQMRGCYWSC